MTAPAQAKRTLHRWSYVDGTDVWRYFSWCNTERRHFETNAAKVLLWLKKGGSWEYGPRADRGL
jgi:hypothetical protein